MAGGSLADPGESLEFGYDYFATASTGFGETAVFAAIGDPFNLTTGGGRFEFLLGDAPPNSVPEQVAQQRSALVSQCFVSSRAVDGCDCRHTPAAGFDGSLHPGKHLTTPPADRQTEPSVQAPACG
jgi:hypothetical protein